MDNVVAIVGMSCRFAGVGSVTAFWDAIRSRRIMLSKPTSEIALGIGERNLFDRPYPTSIGQLGELYSCVPAMQNFPRQVNAGENQDLYFATQLAFDALTDAAMKPHAPDPVKGSVRLGYAPPFNASTVNWLQHTTFLDQTMEVIHRFFPNAPEESLEGVKEKLVESLPPPNAASFLLGTGYRFVSWIARECAFLGTATIMDSGILSGAGTIADAIGDLVSGKSDVALAGTITPPFSRAYIEGLSGEIDFSTRPELHPFASTQDGTIPGEGGAFFVLKRREDALRDRDRIYALVRSVAIGHAPEDNPSAIIEQAVAEANAPIRSVGLIEADGSGVAASEARELRAIQRLWGEHRPGGELVGVGSVKGNIGHTLRSAISAGVMKAALALYHRILPAQIAAEHSADVVSSLASSAYLLNEERPWITGDSSSPRRALVLGSNFDAINPIGKTSIAGRSAAILLEEEPEARL